MKHQLQNASRLTALPRALQHEGCLTLRCPRQRASKNAFVGLSRGLGFGLLQRNTDGDSGALADDAGNGNAAAMQLDQ